MKYILSILLLVPSLLFGQGYDGNSVTGTNVNVILPQSGWSYYDAGDAPEGAYYHGSVASVKDRTAVVTLPETLVAGTYRFILRAEHYNKDPEIYLTLGDGTSNTIDIDAGEETDDWTFPMDVTTTTSASTITIYFDTAPTTNLDLQCLIRALYYTTNMNEDMYGNRDVVFDYSWPATEDTTVDTSDNIFATSSFEFDLGFWRIQQNNRTNALSAFISTADSHHGQASLYMVEFGRRSWPLSGVRAQVYSAPFRVKPNREYTLSLWYKNSGGTTAGDLYIQSPIDDPASPYSNVISATVSMPYSATWTQVEVTTFLKDYPEPVYEVRIVADQGTYIDEVMLTEGDTAPSFNLKEDLELGWRHTEQGGVYYTNESSAPLVYIWNDGATATIDVNYEWWDHHNALVASGVESVSVTGSDTNSVEIPLPAESGYFRGLAWSGGQGPYETIACLVPEPVANVFFGTHGWATATQPDWRMENYKRIGLKSIRLMSPDARFRWSVAEPTDDNFVHWTDANANMGITNDFEILATLIGGPGDIPGYAGSMSSLTISMLTNHVANMASNYTMVHDFEIMNEPSQGGAVLADYTNLLYHSARAIKAEDPTAQVIAMGGTATTSWVEDTMDSWGVDLATYIDGISIHAYPASQDPYSSGGAIDSASGWKTSVLDVYGLPMQNTESGQWDWGALNLGTMRSFMGGTIYKYSWNETYTKGLQNSVWHILRHGLAYNAFGFEKFFYYDSRDQVNGHWEESHTTSDNGNETMAPKFMSLALMNTLTASTTGAGLMATTDAEVVMLYFEDAGDSMATVWTDDASSWTMLSTNVLYYDHFGAVIDPISGSTFQLNRMPIYMKPDSGLTSAQFQSALTNATLTSIANTTPPKAYIFEFPGSTILDTNMVYMRWFGIDDQSHPGEYTQEAVSFRHKWEYGDDNTYTDWGTTIDGVFFDVPPVNTFYVQVRDLELNTATFTREFGAGGGNTITATGLTTTTLRVE